MRRIACYITTLAVLCLTACGGGGTSQPAAGGVTGGGNGTTAPVTQTPAAPLSTAKALSSFSLAATAATISESGRRVDVTVPAGTDLRNLAASFSATGKEVTVNGAKQASGVTTNDFTNGVPYTVVAEDGSSSRYTVYVSLAPSTAKAFTAFSLGGTAGIINETTRTIAVNLPYGTNLQALIAGYSTTGTSVYVGATVQANGYSINNYSNPVTFQVRAADGSSVAYTVTATVALNSAKSLSWLLLNTGSTATPAFFTAGGTQGTQLKATVPFGTPLTALVANYLFVGVKMSVGGVTQVNNVTANNFTNPVVYRITAQDGSTIDYTLTVDVALPTPLKVLSTTPATNEAPGSVFGPVTALFNKALDPATCLPANFKVSGTAGTLRCTGASISFTPSAAFALSRGYTATLTTGLKDVDGLTLPADVAWNFTTASEYTPPYVLGASYSNSVVKVEFSEAMNAASLTSSTIALSPAATGSISSSGALATFTASPPLAKGVTYTATVAGARDLSGNTQSPAYSWQFQTDPGSVVPVEYQAGGNCYTATPAKFFSVEAVNDTGVAQDILICIKNYSASQYACFSYKNVAPGGHTPISLNPSTGWSASSGACYASGDYVITATPTAGPASAEQVTRYKSTTWVANPPTVDPCFSGGSIANPNCPAPFPVPPVVSTPPAPSPTTPPTNTVGTEPDADGCYVPVRNPVCLVVEKIAFDSFSQGQTNLRLRNNCARRVYADFCIQLNNGKWDCGADGAEPGKAITTWSFDATLKYKYQYTGSTRAVADWTCHGKDKTLMNPFP